MFDFLFVIDDSGHSGSGIVEFQDWGPLGGLLGNTGDILGHEPLVTVSPPGARPGPPQRSLCNQTVPSGFRAGRCLSDNRASTKGEILGKFHLFTDFFGLSWESRVLSDNLATCHSSRCVADFCSNSSLVLV